jgi:hypothetical protein
LISSKASGSSGGGSPVPEAASGVFSLEREGRRARSGATGSPGLEKIVSEFYNFIKRLIQYNINVLAIYFVNCRRPDYKTWCLYNYKIISNFKFNESFCLDCYFTEKPNDLFGIYYFFDN